MNVSAGRRRPSVIIRAGFALLTIGTLVLTPVADALQDDAELLGNTQLEGVALG